MSPRDEQKLLDAAGQLDLELPEPKLTQLVDDVLGPVPRRARWPWAVGAAAAIAAALVLLPQPSTTRVTEIEGVVSVNGQVLADFATAPNGAVIETGAETTARLGDVVLGPNTRVVLTEPLELRAGVLFVGSKRAALVASNHVTVEGSAWLIAEPLDQVDRVTARLDHHPPEDSMRSLLLTLALPVVALGATTTPAVVVTDGKALVGKHEVSAGTRWPAAQGAPVAVAPAGPDPRISALEAQVAKLEKQLEALQAQKKPAASAPSLAPIRGTVVDALGKPQANAAVAVYAGGRLSDVSYTDADGRFAVDSPADVDGTVYAKKDDKSVTAVGARPGSNLSLMLAEPGKLSVRVTPAVAGKITLWTSVGGVGAAFPGTINGKSFTGERVQLDRPAGELAVHVTTDGDPRLAGHARVRIEPGRETTLTIELQPAESAIRGRVLDAVTRKSLKGYRVSLLLADDSIEAQYVSEDAEFSFGARSGGERFISVVAEGYKPAHVRASPDGKKNVDLGPVLLEPL